MPLHPPTAVRAGRSRKSGIARLQKIRADLRPDGKRAIAEPRLDRVQIRNPAAPQLRLQPVKRPAELRLDRRMQRLRPGRRLAAANPAALAPIVPRNAVLLADQGRLLRRLLVRQTPQTGRRVRMAELRVLCLDRHDALCCSCPGSAAPAVRGSSETAPEPIHAGPRRPRLQPSNAEPGRNAKTQNRITQESGTHPVTRG